jgi:predicted dehydrogenase
MIPFAIIGTGWIVDSFVNCAHASEQWQLVAVYSRHEDTAKHFATKHERKDAKIHTTIESLAADDAVKAVYIASPNSLHYSHATAMLQAGKHVIVEKPATSTVTEFEALFKLAKEKGVMLLEAFRHLQEINFKVLHENLGKLGPIYGANLAYASYSSRYNNVLAGETPNIFSLDYSGGSLVDIGVYAIAFAVALFGKPQSVSYKPVIVKTGVDGGGHVMLNYETFGVHADQSKCYTSVAPTEIFGEKGAIRCNGVADIESVDFWEAKTNTVEKLGKERVHLNLLEEAREFARIIEEKDGKAAEELEEISRIVIGVTTELRRQNGILFKVEKEKEGMQ